MAAAEEITTLLRETARFTADLAARYSYVENRDVGLRPIANALVTRTSYPGAGQVTGAVYDGDRRLIRSSQRIDPIGIQPVDPEIATEAAVTHLPRAVYGGMLFLILGHFLFESLGRLWTQLDRPLVRCGKAARMPIIFHPCEDFSIHYFMSRPFLKQGLAAFGIDRSNLLLAERDFQIDVLYYPETMSIYHEYVHPQMIRVIDHLAQEFDRRPSLFPLRPARPDARIFLSRGRWDRNLRIANEHAIAEAFRERGFVIVHPQDLSPDRMVRLMRGAEAVASSDGSHAHLAVFARPGTRCLHLDTRPVPTQTAIEALRGLRAHHVPLFANPGGIWDSAEKTVDVTKLGPLIDLIASDG